MKKIGLNSVIGFMIGIVADMFIFFSSEQDSLHLFWTVY